MDSKDITKYKKANNEDCRDNIVEVSSNSHVQLSYDILTIIFKILNAKDLRNAARVCRNWREAARNENRTRGASPLVFLRKGPFCNVFSYEKPLIDCLRVKPALSIMFTHHSKRILDNVECPCEILPSKCIHITVGSNGIVNDKLESMDPITAVHLLLPKCHQVSIDTVWCMTGGTWGGVTFPLQHQDWSTLEELQKILAIKNKVKCFVILACEDYRQISSFLNSSPRNLLRTFSGCLTSNLTICMNHGMKICKEPMYWIAILISGSNVDSWSAVLPSECDTKEKIEKKLMKLRKQVRLKKNSMAFMFACEGRGEYMFRESNVESTIFKKLFPEVPLVGCSGGGEYGNSSIDELTQLNHQFSTVFMIVTYG